MNPTKDLVTPPPASTFLPTFATALIATLLASLLFRLVPALDIAASQMFYVAGSGFPATSAPALKLLRTLGLWTMNGAMIAVAVVAILRCGLPIRLLPRALAAIRPSRLLFLVASAAIGPGLIANLILKDHWGRARPITTSLFGGDAPFTLPWTISDACHRNCSFVSGEASGAFWLIALVFVVPAAWRRAVAGPLLVWIAAISLNRIAFGGHFLSDILIGWGLMLLTILVCRDILISRYGAAIDGWFQRWQGN
jgi:membrane-associated phospholipid phosphatase